MDELIARLTAAANIGEDAAKKAVGIIFGFVEKEAPQLQLDKLLAAIPGVDDLVAAAAASAGSAGGLFGKIGGMLGGAGGDLVAAFGRLESEAGLDTGQVETVGKEIFAFLRAKLGDDAVSKILSAVPGLNKFA
ncbi:DUF2780 domain-containing protein [Methylocapsa sp. S129]|uniref:DUF2780 domain-containing protein n=1 Tax=Methylocapsa sp. S129 TaxID=1641869 RepID=UPI00131B41E5|nr:DUF2780 domain-containing protein [Methylocapsa sp. S129]